MKKYKLCILWVASIFLAGCEDRQASIKPPLAREAQLKQVEQEEQPKVIPWMIDPCTGLTVPGPI